MPPGLRRYAGILLDLSFDHCLSRHWPLFSTLPLREFSDVVHRALTTHENELSDKARAMRLRIAKHDLLALYGDWETVIAAAGRIGQRFRQRNPFLDLSRQLSPKKAVIEQTFMNFYPQLQSFCKNWNSHYGAQASG